jgi:hypothetical protein
MIMAEALGVISAVAQITECVFKIVSFTKELASDVKNGQTAVLRRLRAANELVVATSTPKATSNIPDAIDPHISSCHEEAIAIRDELQAIADFHLHGQSKSGWIGLRWHTEKNTIDRMFAELERRKSTLLISMCRLLPYLYEHAVAMRQEFPDLHNHISAVQEKLDRIHNSLDPEMQAYHSAVTAQASR